jgi:hypothetical protein
MANVTPGYQWTSGEVVTPAKMNAAATPTVALNDGEVITNTIADGAVTPQKLPATLDLSTKTVTLANGSVTNDSLALAAGLPIFACRAWVNFDGTTAANLGGTYTRSGTTITVVTTTAHGLNVGHRLGMLFTSGALSSSGDGEYTVNTVVNSTTFTITSTTSGTIGGAPTCSLRRRLIRASGNVANVAYLETGKYAVNFSTAMPDENYCAVNGSGGTEASNQTGILSPGPASNANRFVFTIVNTSANPVDRNRCMLAFFR